MSVANAIALDASLSCNNPNSMGSPVSRSITGFTATQNNNPYIEGSLAVQITATAVPLGGVTVPGWSYFRNLDESHYVQLMNGASGAVFARLYPGWSGWIPLDPACVPYAIANVAICQLEYLILSY